MRKRIRRPFVPSIRILVWLWVAAFPIGEAAAQDANSLAPPSSRAVLRAMSETLQAATRLSFRAEIAFDDVEDDGRKIQYGGELTGRLRRPDGLSLDYRDDLSAKQVWYDGRSLTLYDPDHDVYATVAAPPRVEQAIDQFERDYGLFLPLSELIIGNPYEQVLSRALSGSYVGIHDVDGIACHHVAFVGENIDFQLWVEQGPTALPRKLVVTYKQQLSSPQYEAKLKDWNLDAKLTDAEFQSRVPKDAVAIRFLDIQEARR